MYAANKVKGGSIIRDDSPVFSPPFCFHLCLSLRTSTMLLLTGKLVHFIMFICLMSILGPPVVGSSSQQHVKTPVGNIHKVDHKLMFEIKLHGFLLWASMGFFMPVGILTIRLSNMQECGRRLKILFYVHVVSQILSLLLATAGAVMSVKNFNNSFNNHHQRLGLALYCIIWLQALIGVLRPSRGSKGRSGWFSAHWLLGTAASVLGIINIYTGLVAYHEKTSRSIKLWTILLTAEISLIAFVYLFQDKWLYIQKQGVILGDEPVTVKQQDISSAEKPKGSSSDNC
ncbi:cytochrome b561 domain-containing protein At2g30890-like [Hibiscus syriacus]|uniref:cytochrome b561 domain-containing protein At2g30890-like n=1 Tax=Hibiscus syriacus TaxID=106335 RepID=UPI001924FCA3|nr:cytochrome b561 domain-containing protein At2g30890-like [Hibiscus syriacus]